MQHHTAVPVFFALACGNAKESRTADTGLPVTGDPPACITEAPRHFPGCLIIEREDPEADGRHFTEVRTSYDGLGRVVSTDRRAARDYDDWSVCGYEWLGDGVTPLSEWCVGRSTFVYSWEHDENGYPSRKLYDAGIDGTVDRIWLYETDTAGRITWAGQDQDLDGSVDSSTTYQFDSNGNLTAEVWDYNEDGGVDYRRTFTYDDAGNLLTEETDSDGDGVLDSITTWARDQFGNPLEMVEDDGADGTTDVTRTWTWQACKATQIEDRDRDGNRVRTSLTYDTAHRLSSTATDLDGTAGAEATTSWEYICPF